MLRRAAVVLLAALLTPTASAAEWLEVRTANFRFIGDAPERDIQEIASRLEQFREVLRRAAPGLTPTSPVPTIVVVFSGMRSFGPYQPLRDGRRVSTIAGFFQAADTVNYIATTATGGPAAIRLVFHEYAHFLIANRLGETPAWFSEGMAQLYETTEIRDDGHTAIVGMPLAQHIPVLTQRAMMPLEQLMAATDALTMLHASAGPSMFYSQSWALMHYLMLGSPARARQLRTYIDALERGDTPESAFAEVFGGDTGSLSDEVGRYVRGMKFGGRLFPFADAVTGGDIPPARRMADAEAEAYLADLLARTGREDEARARLEALLETNPDNGRAAASLGWLELRGSRPDAALPLLRRAAALRPDDAAIVGAFGMALYEQARRGSSDRASADAAFARARMVLARAVALDVPAAPTLVALADVETALGGDLLRARDLMAQAVALAPSRQEYRLALAEALLRVGDRESAREQLDLLAARSATLTTTVRAQQLLVAMGGSPGSPVSADLPGRSRPALRIVRDGERRVLGQFVRMECGGRFVQFLIETDTGALRLDEVLGGVQVIAYRPAPPTMSCGAIAGAPRVLATYRPVTPGAPGSAGVDGVVVAIEILPEGFVP